jgi:phosphocarrier protein HPr
MANERTMVREFEVLNTYGIHARPAALLVKAASKFACDIFIGYDGAEVSAKSIMGLLTIEGHQGARLVVRAVGADAEKALEEISALFENKFFED